MQLSASFYQSLSSPFGPQTAASEYSFREKNMEVKINEKNFGCPKLKWISQPSKLTQCATLSYLFGRYPVRIRAGEFYQYLPTVVIILLQTKSQCLIWAVTQLQLRTLFGLRLIGFVSCRIVFIILEYTVHLLYFKCSKTALIRTLVYPDHQLSGSPWPLR